MSPCNATDASLAPALGQFHREIPAVRVCRGALSNPGVIMKLVYAAVAATLLVASPVMAADDGGFYVGAGIGIFGVEEGSFDESDTGFKLFGGWMFNQYVGGELEYIDGGTVGDSDLGVDSTGINLALKGNWPVTEQFDVFGKVGYFFWDADIDLTGDSGQEQNESGSDLSWGIGAGYDFTPNFGVIAEWQWFQIEEADADMMSASVVWKF
jgi:OOP family OmpA-OmpF porin